MFTVNSDQIKWHTNNYINNSTKSFKIRITTLSKTMQATFRTYFERACAIHNFIIKYGVGDRIKLKKFC
jgi:hypothetical protein